MAFNVFNAFTIDDQSLLRAINVFEGTLEGHQAAMSDVVYSNSLKLLVMEQAEFQIIKENSHLRKLLKEFLICNLRVQKTSELLSDHLGQNFVLQMFTRHKKAILKAELTDLEEQRDKAFNNYEMLRRLTDWENHLLRRYKF